MLTTGVTLGIAQAGTTYAVVYGVIGRNVPAERRSWAMGVTAAAGSFGQFLMVPIEGGWWAAKYEITQAQFEQVMGSNPSLFRDPLRPVERVSWNEAAEFCRKLTDAERQAGRLPEGYVYRLPTLAEFETLAADTPLSEAILAGDKTFWHTQPVGSRAANRFGLHDIVGNVWEWTTDSSDKGNRMKCSFGGSFANTPEELALHPLRNATLDFFSRVVMSRLFGPTRQDYPDQAFWDRGFRVVLATKRTTQK
jgi:formylglycine-generating enzyme required for sulfatase activity